MPESMRRNLSLKSKVIRNIGIVLIVLSFLVPLRWGDLRLFGGGYLFIATPGFALQEISVKPDEQPSHPLFLFIIVMTAWLANFTIFTRLPVALALIAILLPWPAYIFLFSDCAGYIPFYPWAIGIALVHISRFRTPLPKTALGPTPTAPSAVARELWRDK